MTGGSEPKDASNHFSSTSAAYNPLDDLEWSTSISFRVVVYPISPFTYHGAWYTGISLSR